MVVSPSPPFEVLTQDGCLNEKEEELPQPHNYKIKRRPNVTGRRVSLSWVNGVKKNYGAPREREGKKGTIHN